MTIIHPGIPHEKPAEIRPRNFSRYSTQDCFWDRFKHSSKYSSRTSFGNISGIPLCISKEMTPQIFSGISPGFWIEFLLDLPFEIPPLLIYPEILSEISTGISSRSAMWMFPGISSGIHPENPAGIVLEILVFFFFQRFRHEFLQRSLQEFIQRFHRDFFQIFLHALSTKIFSMENFKNISMDSLEKYCLGTPRILNSYRYSFRKTFTACFKKSSKKFKRGFFQQFRKTIFIKLY